MIQYAEATDVMQSPNIYEDVLSPGDHKGLNSTGNFCFQSGKIIKDLDEISNHTSGLIHKHSSILSQPADGSRHFTHPSGSDMTQEIEADIAPISADRDNFLVVEPVEIDINSEREEDAVSAPGFMQLY